MQKLIVITLAGLGALLAWDLNRKKNGSQQSKESEKVSEAQIRKVMSHLGKRSGEVRGGK